MLEAAPLAPLVLAESSLQALDGGQRVIIVAQLSNALLKRLPRDGLSVKERHRNRLSGQEREKHGIADGVQRERGEHPAGRNVRPLDFYGGSLAWRPVSHTRSPVYSPR